MHDRYAKRCYKLRKLLKAAKIPAILVQKEVNVHYLTGFTGEDSILLLTPDRELLITDSRFVTQLADECPGLKLYVRRTGQAVETMDEAVSKRLNLLKITAIGIEADTMSVSLLQKLQEAAKATSFVVTTGLVEQLRMIKDKEEVAEIQRAVDIAEHAWSQTKSQLHPDLTELQVAHQLEAAIRQQGGTGFSFEPIIAAGPRSALPHGRASNAKIGSSNWLLFDWGARYGKSISDLTRVIFTGKISPKLERIYQVVFKAQAAAIAKIRAGANCGDVDAAARKLIAKAGYGDYFGHGLGHGIGIEVHEQPRFNAGNKGTLEAGMVVTIEPGIYLPGVGGVRLEDDILVTKTGHRVLSSLPKTWEQARFEWSVAH